MKQKKVIFKLVDFLECAYTYSIVTIEKKGKAPMFEISTEGMTIVAKEFIKKGKIVRVHIAMPPGSLDLITEVASTKLEWYITDEKKDMRFTTKLIFKDLPIKTRTHIIKYIYSCRKEFRDARLKRLGL